MESRSEQNGSKPGSRDNVSPGIERQIEENLRLIYQEALEEGIPPTLQALADKLQELLSGEDRDGKEKS